MLTTSIQSNPPPEFQFYLVMNDKELQLSRDLGDYFAFYNHILIWGFTYFIVSFDRLCQMMDILIMPCLKIESLPFVRLTTEG